jgi:hypothetical protein
MKDETLENVVNDVMDTKDRKIKRTKNANKKAKVVTVAKKATKAAKKAKVVKAVKKAIKAIKKDVKGKVKTVKKAVTKKAKTVKTVVNNPTKLAVKNRKIRHISQASNKNLAKASAEAGGIGALGELCGYSHAAINRVMYGDFVASHKLACALEDATKGFKAKVTYKNLRGVNRPK